MGCIHHEYANLTCVLLMYIICISYYVIYTNMCIIIITSLILCTVLLCMHKMLHCTLSGTGPLRMESSTPHPPETTWNDVPGPSSE